MSTLALLDDVKLILKSLQEGYDDTQDARLQRLLDATEDFVRRTYGINDYITNSPGTVTESFFGYKDGDILTLSDENPTNIEIVFVDFSGDERIVLQPPRFLVMSNGRIELRFKGLVAPFEGAAAKATPVSMPRIEVTYAPSITSSSMVPPSLVEAVALTAAFAWKQQEMDMAGLRSEAIGSYSYTRDDKSIQLTMPARARALLRNFNRKRFIQVT